MQKTLFIMAWLFCHCLFAQTNPHWFRYAAISPDGAKIAFTFKGDLYVVPTTGGTAQPLTFHEAHDFMPVYRAVMV